jgi:hypothetical protein
MANSSLSLRALLASFFGSSWLNYCRIGDAEYRAAVPKAKSLVGQLFVGRDT